MAFPSECPRNYDFIKGVPLELWLYYRSAPETLALLVKSSWNWGFIIDSYMFNWLDVRSVIDQLQNGTKLATIIDPTRVVCQMKAKWRF